MASFGSSLVKTTKSILNQNYKNIEIIIVDDCSNDGTESLVIDKLLNSDRRIKYIRHKKNKGLAVARNTAINKAKGKYFTFCDDDDLWEPNFIKEFIKEASNYNKDWCFCCSEKNKYSLNKGIKIKFKYKGSLKNFIKKGYTPPVAGQFYNLSSLKNVGGYNEEITSGVDHDLWIRLAKKGIKIKYLPKALSIPNAQDLRVRHTTNYTKRIDGIKKSLSIWSDDLKKMYGKTFYNKFYEAYLFREYKKFLITYIQKFDITMIYKIYKDVPSLTFLKIMFNLLFRQLTNILNLKSKTSKKKILKQKPTLIIKS